MWVHIVCTPCSIIDIVKLFMIEMNLIVVLKLINFLVMVVMAFFYIKFLRNDRKDTREGVANGFLLGFLTVIISSVCA